MNPHDLLWPDHFTADEFRCGCGCGLLNIEQPLLCACGQLRRIVERPIHVVSGSRCPWHNQYVGGSQTSLHMAGMAADIRCPSMPFPAFVMACLAIHPEYIRGVGLTFDSETIHIDLRYKPKLWYRQTRNDAYTYL